ncbi:rhomboid family intramembrane serine protease [Carboxylicivirga marina]|uniref:Rhomboid family intramembrane serine protease n=1 Tax=Carboxylicivirga marina TaxID=2800988 RepID=A0ABS1HQE2_9BACT|nr:rhomboid family intramembrane serine protease [Carboxylicivirga marina]MBK3519893.1 rhomboid family intramembrane serine protease [Carboxylicivirga marina]
MENIFSQKMADKSDLELKEILENRYDYQEEAFSAALYEVEKRRKAKVYNTPAETTSEQKLKEEEEAEEENDKHRSVAQILSGLIPSSGYIVTPLIIYINIFIYLLMVIMGVHPVEPSVDSLIEWGGNIRVLSLDGEAWRLLTCAFLHIGAMHLLFNMYALLFIGKEIETQIGSSKFLFAYLVTAILASITSIAVNDNVVGAGASGAIFGMYGVLISLVLLKGLEIPQETRKNFLTSVFTFVGYNLFFGFTQEGIDNAAHIGGLVSGLLVGGIFYVTKSDLRVTRVTNFVVLVSVALLITALPRLIPNQFGTYTKLMEEFTVMEEKALQVYQLSEHTNDDVYLKAITEESLPSMEKCLTLIVQIDTIGNLPLELQEQNKLLKRYVLYRIGCFQLAEKSINEQTTMYHQDIERYNQKIELILHKLEGQDISDSDLVANPPLTDSDEPLIIFDGMPILSNKNINHSIIESIEVLKDEAATSIYGERGKNGVVLINTKKQ